MSETCDSEFSYRISKIDEEHETSSELAIQKLFEGVDDKLFVSGEEPVKGIVKVGNGVEFSKTNDINVAIYLRLQINYFGVTLKLLYFFAIRSYTSMHDGRGGETDKGVFKKIMVQQ